ncbi:MAG: 50S ribosomal protein L21 [Deltaproteobacteria bacterium]|nr:50S ribosomal protein L21 [Deltaproteobacteria bacterium]
MEAIIQTGGKQYKVKQGQKIKVEELSAEVGSELSFDCLALLGDDPKIGQPLVSGAKVVAKVVGHDRAKKIVITKFKRRKGYMRTQGHRQNFTCLEVTDVQAG